MEFALASQYAFVLFFKYSLLATNATVEGFSRGIKGVGLGHSRSLY
jgi:hypothetical protein